LKDIINIYICKKYKLKVYSWYRKRKIRYKIIFISKFQNGFKNIGIFSFNRSSCLLRISYYW